MTNKYEFVDGMGEISGFGGDYEQACRAMLKAGLEWMDDNPDADPHYGGFKNIYGLMIDTNEDAKELDKAVISACDGCSGAMHQAVVSHILWIKAHSWDEYVIKMKERN